MLLPPPLFVFTLPFGLGNHISLVAMAMCNYPTKAMVAQGERIIAACVSHSIAIPISSRGTSISISSSIISSSIDFSFTSCNIMGSSGIGSIGSDIIIISTSRASMAYGQVLWFAVLGTICSGSSSSAVASSAVALAHHQQQLHWQHWQWHHHQQHQSHHHLATRWCTALLGSCHGQW